MKKIRLKLDMLFEIIEIAFPLFENSRHTKSLDHQITINKIKAYLLLLVRCDSCREPHDNTIERNDTTKENDYA